MFLKKPSYEAIRGACAKIGRPEIKYSMVLVGKIVWVLFHGETTR